MGVRDRFLRIVGILFICAGCGGSEIDPSSCTSTSQCDVVPGGVCMQASSGTSWCQYPDSGCPSGIRWSPYAGDGLGGVCVGVYSVTVSKTGSGSGTVQSEPAGIDCGDTCMAEFAEGARVRLTAVASGGSIFAGWGGDAASCGTSLQCELDVTATRTVTAGFDEIPDFAIGITLAGTGAGRVASDPTGIDCGSTCVFQFEEGTPVTLSASAEPGSVFTGWLGDAGECGVAVTCSVTTTQARAITARFTAEGTAAWGSVSRGAGHAAARRHATDPHGDVIVAGTFSQGELVLDDYHFAAHAGAHGPADIFVAKLRGLDGKVVWARAFGGTGTALSVSSLAVSPITGDIALVVEILEAPVDLGGGSVPAFTFAIVMYSGIDGAFEWQQTVNGGSSYRVGLSPSNDLYATALFGNTIVLDPGSAAPQTLTAYGDTDSFVAKFSPSGSLVWTYQLGAWGTATGFTHIGALAVDAAGNAVVAGNFDREVRFGVTTWMTPMGTNAFLAKYNGSTGGLVWARRMGGQDASAFDFCLDMTIVPPSDEIAIGCQSAVGGTLEYGGAVVGPSFASPETGVIARYSASNTFRWARKFGGDVATAGSLRIERVMYDPTNDRVLVGGEFSNSGVVFSEDVTLPRPSAADHWLASFGAIAPADAQWAHELGGGTGLTVDSMSFERVRGWMIAAGGFSTFLDIAGFQATPEGGGDSFVVAVVPRS